MKKYLTPCLAVIAVVAIVLCIVFAGQRGVKQTDVDAQIAKAVEEAKTAAAAEKDEAVKAVTDAADAAKAEADAKIADLTKQLEEAPKAEDIQAQVTAAAEAAQTEAQAKLDEAVAAAQTELQGKMDEAVKAANETAEKEKAELTKQLEEAQAAVETVKAEMQTKLDEAAKGADEAAKTALETAEKEKADLQAQLEAAVKEKDEAVAAAKAEAEAKIAELTKQAEEAAAAATTAVTEAVDTAKEAVAEPATEEKAEEKTEEKTEEPAAAAPAVMTYAEYIAAPLDSEVCVQTNVQATQSWWDGKITVYAVTAGEGGYFIYNMACSEEDAAKLVPGTTIRVKGYKSEWSGEVEITDATFELVDDGFAFTAAAQDVTDLIGKEELINRQNDYVLFKGMTVEAYDESGAAFAYKDAEGKTDDLYFKASKDGTTVNFCVEFYLTGKDTDVYKAVEGLQVGDVIDIEGFLYWYEGANPHVVKVTKAQ